VRNFLTVFAASFKYCWRNLVSVAIVTVFPIMLILVLGTALKGYISPDTKLELISVAAVTEPNGNLEEFLKSDEISKFLDVTFTQEKEAFELVEKEEASIAVVEKDGKISVIRHQAGDMNTQTAETIIDSYAQINAAMTIAVKNIGNLSELSALKQIIGSEISIAEAPLGKRVPSSTDYYAVTMLVMILLFAGMNGFELFKKSLVSETGERILTAPVSKPALIGGLIAAATVTS